MKTAQQYIDEALVDASRGANNSALEYDLDSIARMMIRKGMESDLLRCAIRLLEHDAMFAIDSLKREISGLRTQLAAYEASDAEYRLDHIESQLDARDRASDMNDELACRACAARQVA